MRTYSTLEIWFLMHEHHVMESIENGYKPYSFKEWLFWNAVAGGYKIAIKKI